MYKNVLEYLEKTAAGAAADRGVSDVDTFMTYPAFVEMARNAGAAMTGLVPAGRPVAVFAEKGVRTLAAMIGNVISDLIGGWGFWFDWSIGNGILGFFVARAAEAHQIVHVLVPKSIIGQMVNYQIYGCMAKLALIFVML